MPYLPTLLKKIEQFAKFAQEYDNDQNPPHFDELESIAHKIDDPGLGQQLSILAELYKRALKIGGGYATIARAINNVKDMYSDDTDTDIEFILNGMLSELAKQAGGRVALSGQDNSRFVQQLVQLKQDIELRNQDQQSDAINAYQEDVNVPGASGENEDDYSENGLGTEQGDVVFDPTAGLGGDKDAVVNRGWHTTGRAELHKNWAEYYENEKKEYETALTQASDPKIKSVLSDIIKELNVIIPKTIEYRKLYDAYQTVPDETTKSKLENLNNELRTRKQEKSKLKSKLRTHNLGQQKTQLEKELAGTNDKRVKELLEQKIALNALSSGSGVAKSKERNLRLRLIEAMSNGNFPSEATLNSEKLKIEQAKNTRLIENQKYQKLMADKTRAIKNMVEPEKRKVNEHTNRAEKMAVYDWANITLQGLEKHLSQKILGERKSVKDAVLNVLEKEDKDTIFKPYLDDIADASNRNDKTALLQAVKKLKSNMLDIVKHEPRIIQYIVSVRSSKFFYAFRDQVKKLKEMQVENKLEPMNEEEKLALTNAITTGQKLIEVYSTLEMKPLANSPDRSYKNYYKALVKLTAEVINKLTKIQQGAK